MEKLKYYKYKAFLLYSKINFYHIMKGNEGIVNTILIIFLKFINLILKLFHKQGGNVIRKNSFKI